MIMPSNILALLFTLVLAGLTFVNHALESPSPKPDVIATPLILELSPTPSPTVATKLSSPSPLASPLPQKQINPTPSPETPPLPSISSRAYILSDSRGRVLLGRNTGEFLPIASLTKLMTAVVFWERFPDDGKLEISKAALALNQNTYGLLAGDTLTKQEALEFMLVASSNIVSQSAAEAFGTEEFIKWMNDKARELGMMDTLFIDPSGLGDFSRSTANDMVKLLRYIAANHPEILAISRSPSVEFRKGTSRSLTIFNTNKLAGKVAGIIGGKTGYTPTAGGCLAVVFEWRGRTFYAVVLGSQDRFSDMRALIEYAWNLQ
jgi:D-alanyl-D-alanine carboxypeptidase